MEPARFKTFCPQKTGRGKLLNKQRAPAQQKFLNVAMPKLLANFLFTEILNSCIENTDIRCKNTG